MSRADPSRSSEVATRHLFRHLFDEQELLRNPFVGADLRAGFITMGDLRARVSQAATAIENEDRAAGNDRRGARQAACLTECTLKGLPIAEVAKELGISRRQLFRERQLAWVRAVRYIVAPTAPGPNDASPSEVLCNHACVLFASGDRAAALRILLDSLARARGIEAVMLACLISELHLLAEDAAGARTFLGKARVLCDQHALNGSTTASLTLRVLGELIGEEPRGAPKLRFGAGLLDGIVFETGVRWWMVRLTTRLLIMRSSRAFAARERRMGVKIAQSAISLGEMVPNLPPSEQFAVRLLTAHLGWTTTGPSPSVDAALLSSYLIATSNGWLREAAHIAALLSATLAISGKPEAEKYAQTALSLASMFAGEEAGRLVHLNLAVAHLDAGRYPRAAELIEAATPPDFTSGDYTNEYDVEFDLLRNELNLAKRSGGDTGLSVRKVHKAALVGGDPLSAAYSARLMALALDSRGESRAAKRHIAEALEIAADQGHWLSLRTVRRTYARLTNAPAPARYISDRSTDRGPSPA